jgi:hypothetical protein
LLLTAGLVIKKLSLRFIANVTTQKDGKSIIHSGNDIISGVQRLFTGYKKDSLRKAQADSGNNCKPDAV